MLEILIRKEYGIYVPYNRIHEYLMDRGFAELKSQNEKSGSGSV